MGGIVTYKPGRGRTVMKRSVNVNPRNGLTMKMIMKACTEVKLPLKNAHTLRILQVKDGRVVSKGGKHKGKAHRAIRFLIRDSERTTPRDPIKKHDVLVYFLEPSSVTDAAGQVPWNLSGKNVNIVCSCDCENFMYMWEYALAHFKASFIKYSNGEPPVTTNPGLIPAACKHLWLAFRTIQQKGW